jgi:single-stranded-DNA-specific exonuclease
MATIADMMPRIADNEKIIEQGLDSLRESWRPGIQALFNIGSLKIDLFNYLSPVQQVEKINSLLNIPDIKDGSPAAFRLLTCSDIKEAEKLAEKLLQESIKKKEKIREIIFFLEEKIFENPKSPIVFEGSSDWQLILLGTAASIISQRSQKPVFLYKKGEKESPGSVRAPNGFNVVEAMKQCSKILITFGGHPQAAGFRIKNENLEEFKERLIKFFVK